MGYMGYNRYRSVAVTILTSCCPDGHLLHLVLEGGREEGGFLEGGVTPA